LIYGTSEVLSRSILKCFNSKSPGTSSQLYQLREKSFAFIGKRPNVNRKSPSGENSLLRISSFSLLGSTFKASHPSSLKQVPQALKTTTESPLSTDKSAVVPSAFVCNFTLFCVQVFPSQLLTQSPVCACTDTSNSASPIQLKQIFLHCLFIASTLSFFISQKYSKKKHLPHADPHKFVPYLPYDTTSAFPAYHQR